MICDTCGFDKVVRRVGHGFVTAYYDTRGRKWASGTCPTCQLKAKRIEEITARRCRACNAKLPESRYFRCHGCCYARFNYSGDEYGAQKSLKDLARGAF